jgi:hypothetical protein
VKRSTLDCNEKSSENCTPAGCVVVGAGTVVVVAGGCVVVVAGGAVVVVAGAVVVVTGCVVVVAGAVVVVAKTVVVVVGPGGNVVVVGGATSGMWMIVRLPIRTLSEPLGAMTPRLACCNLSPAVSTMLSVPDPDPVSPFAAATEPHVSSASAS